MPLALYRWYQSFFVLLAFDGQSKFARRPFWSIWKHWLHQHVSFLAMIYHLQQVSHHLEKRRKWRKTVNFNWKTRENVEVCLREKWNKYSSLFQFVTIIQLCHYLLSVCPFQLLGRVHKRFSHKFPLNLLDYQRHQQSRSQVLLHRCLWWIVPI